MVEYVNWDTVAAVGTAIGVTVAAWQIRESRKLAQSTFEDSLDQQYRELAHGIPVDALLGKEIDEMDSETRELIYNYLDLCNEQLFLRKRKRITKETWNDWSLGISAHLAKPAFKLVWNEVKNEAPGSFTFLEQWEDTGFTNDPSTWK
jgi:hypothetical protein